MAPLRFILIAALVGIAPVDAPSLTRAGPDQATVWPHRRSAVSMRPDSPLGLGHLPELVAHPAPRAVTMRGEAAADAAVAWESRRGAAAASWEDVVDIASGHGRIYVLSSSTGLDTGFDIVTAAFDAATGTELWRDRFDLGGDTDVAQGIAIDPGGGRVYVTGYSFAGGTFHSIVVALDAADGSSAWTLVGDGVNQSENGLYSIEADEETVFVAGTVASWPAAANRIASGNVQWTSLVLAIDASSGRVRWRSTPPGGQIDVARAVRARAGRVIVTGLSRTQLVSSIQTIALDIATGAPLWRAAAPGQSIPELSVNDTQVFVGGDGGTSGLVVAYDASNGLERWRSTRAGETRGLVVAHGRVFAATTAQGDSDVFVVGYDAIDGREIWSDRYARNGAQFVADLETSGDGSTVIMLGSTESAPSDMLLIANDAASGARRWLAVVDGGSGRTDTSRALAIEGERAYAAASSWNGHRLNDENVAAFDGDTGTTAWQRSYDGPGNYGFDVPRRSALSNDGATLFVTGEGSADGGRWTTIAHDATTGGARWTAVQSGPVDDVAAGFVGERPSAIAVAPDDARVYVTGTQLVEVPSQSGVASSRNWMTAAFDAHTGAKAWSVSSPGLPTSSGPSAVAVSPDGATLYVAGMRWSTFPPAGTYADIALVAYDAATGDLLRQVRWDDGGEERASEMTLSPDGTRVYLAGRAWREDLGYHYLVVAFDSATFSVLWTLRTGFDGGFFSAVTGIVSSPDGSRVYVAGSREVPATTDALILRSVAETFALDAATGALSWHSSIGDAGTWADNAGLALSPDGARLYSAGRHISLPATATGFLVAGNDMFAAAFDAADGRRLWLDFYDSGIDGNVSHSPDDLTLALAVSPNDDLWTAGMSWNSATGWDFLTLHYRGSTGERRGAFRYDGEAHAEDVAYAVQAGLDAAFVTGASWASGTSFDYVTIAYRQR